MSAAKQISNAARAIHKGCAKYPYKAATLSPNAPRVSSATPTLGPEHSMPMGSWSKEQISEAVQDNVMLTWQPGKVKNGLPILRRGEGVYLYDDDGNRYLDWTSQAICSNLGFDPPPSVLDAINTQLTELPYVYGGIGMTEVRARMSALMNDILPGDLQGTVFPSSGSEANEAAIMMARRYTGKQKVINWYRGYHGGTNNALQATGDSRRWNAGTGTPGFIKAFNPYPLFFEYAGATEQEQVDMMLIMLEEQILAEGPDDIALISLESIVGAGGVILPPKGYMPGVRALCDKYNILLHCDEVMVGFGRTGTLFGFQNELFEGILPDIVTAAKGISASLIPLSMTACRKHIMEAFEEKSIGWGSTYQAHPVALACAYETVKHVIETDVVGQVQKMAPIFEDSMKQMAENHPSVKQYRAVGLFGCLDTQLPNGENPQLQHTPVDSAYVQYKKACMENGLIGLLRPPHIHIAPSLIISEEELLDGFDRQDKALDVLDEALGF